MNDFRVDETGIDFYLRDPAGDVGEFLMHAAEEIADGARGLADVRSLRSVWSNRTTSARRPGFTKENIHTAHGHFASGDLWSSVNAPANPTIWLEKGTPRMHSRHPFLTEALFTTPVT